MLTKTNRLTGLVAAAAIGLTAVSVTPASADRRSDAAAAAAFAAIVGTIATIAIAEQRRSEWQDYHRPPVYSPPYYGPRRYYGSRHYFGCQRYGRC